VEARPFVVMSTAMSLDGAIDDTSPRRLVLSDAADLDRVDAERARVDAILVGATTIRRDDPRLVLRSAQRRAARVAAGLPPDPMKVTLTASGDLDPAAAFFTTGDALRLVYAGRPVPHLADVATVVGLTDLAAVLADLYGRGVRRLMVEGGGSVQAQFLAADAVDEMQIVVAPFLVGESGAPRFAGPGHYPRRWHLAEASPSGDLVLLRYTKEHPDA
jgi:5-amino-6-(5-phosphoribosylamino)uracil reductase